MLELHHSVNSECAQKVRIALAEKGLLYVEHLMTHGGDQFDPAYMSSSPARSCTRAPPRSCRLAARIPGFSRRNGNFVNFRTQPAFQPTKTGAKSKSCE
jgi:hypothetical protein